MKITTLMVGTAAKDTMERLDTLGKPIDLVRQEERKS